MLRSTGFLCALSLCALVLLTAVPGAAAPAATPVGIYPALPSVSTEDQWARVNQVVEVSLADFSAIREDHRGMLAGMANSVIAIEASGGEAVLPSVCFTDGVSWETVALFEKFSKRGQKFQGADNFRWSQTATDGGGLQQGDAITLRVSFPPDGISLVDLDNPGDGEPNTPNNLNASFDAGFGSRAIWKALLGSVFNDWSERAGLTYVFDVPDDGAAFPVSPGSNTRGDVRITGHTVDGAGAGILAYNYFPNQGDMVIDTGNTNDIYAVQPSNNFRFLRNVVSHEHGHGMGFGHVCPLNNTIIMQPSLTVAFDHSGEDDIRHANRKYGDPKEVGGGNDTPATAFSLGELSIGNGNAGEYLSIDAFSDDDYFRVTTTAPRKVDFVLSPRGSQYQEGPQGTPSPSDNTGCNFSSLSNTNGMAIMNLAVEVVSSDGTNVLASSTSNGVGQLELVDDLVLPANATYFVHVFTNDGPSANISKQVQMYALDFVADVATGTLSIHSPQVRVEEFAAVTLSASSTIFMPSTFIWRKDGDAIANVSGNELVLDPVVISDTGFYTVEADSDAKALVVSPPFYLEVLPVGSLPAVGMFSALVLALALLGTGPSKEKRHSAG